MGKNYFTPEQVEQLRKNKYVKHASEKAITYTEEFKEVFMNEYNLGKLPSQIITEMGFDPIIANVFRRLNIIEAFATGIKRINEAYKNAYVKPTYNFTPSAISITLPVIEDYSLSLNEAKVIDSIKDNYLYSRSDIEKISGFTKDKLIRLLASLQKKGLIEKSGKGRTTYYKKK